MLLLVAGIEEAVASETREAEEVLVFEVCAVAPAENLQGKAVGARFKELCNVEFCLELAVLAVANEFAVDPQINTRCS